MALPSLDTNIQNRRSGALSAEQKAISKQDYREWHKGSGSFAEGYDESLFLPGRWTYEIWRREQALLDRWVSKWAPRGGRYLDFACGTARLVAYLENRFSESVGLDISESMLEQARTRVESASLVCGDATRDPGVVSGTFDCITAFRFFLNAQPALRDEAMAFLAGRLRDERSVLIFNVHGNRLSSRWLPARTGRIRNRTYNEMTRNGTLELIERHGLEVVDWDGLGYVDAAYHKYMPASLWQALEGTLETLRFPKRLAVNLYFACRRKSPITSS